MEGWIDDFKANAAGSWGVVSSLFGLRFGWGFLLGVWRGCRICFRGGCWLMPGWWWCGFWLIGKHAWHSRAG